MFWRSERTKYGHVKEEKVHVYECRFTTTKVNPKSELPYNGNVMCLVVCNTVEEAIEACRQQWPENFILHQVTKRNSGCDLIVVESAMKNAEGGA